MSQAVITKAFTEWKAQQAVDNLPVTLDEFIFAFVPDLDPAKPVSNTEGVPATDKIVHRQAVSKTGVVNANSVVYSVTLGADVGDFDFNWIGLVNKATGTLAMIIHAPTQRKIKNDSGQQGNVLVRSMLMEYSGAQSATNITTPAETWQIDFTARLAGMDEAVRLAALDIYGEGAFFDNGFLVAKNGAQYFVTKGLSYVGGLRAALPANQNITVSAKPTKVWADVCYQGTLTSAYQTSIKFTVADSLTDYQVNGVAHYVFALASIDASGAITDLRPKGSLGDQQGNNDFLRIDKSLSDVKDAVAARRNIGLKSAAVLDVGATADTVAAGDDTRIVNALQKGNNLSELTDKPTARKNLGLGSAAEQDSGTFLAAASNLTDVADKAQARSNLGLKTAAVCDVQTSRDDVTRGRVVTNGGAIAVRSFKAATTAGADTTDANNLPANAVSFVYASAANSPGFEASILDYAGMNEDYNVQLAASYAQKGLVKLRTKNGDSATWGGWTTFYTTDNKPSAQDIGAVSAQGGDYNKTFRFGRIETLANESNMSALYSVQGGSGAIVSGAEFHWYDNQFNIGITRGASYGTGGFVIAHNGYNRLVIDPNGNAAVAGNISTAGTVSGGAINSSGNINGVYIGASDDIYAGRNISCAGSIYSGGALYESGGHVRVYSSNNPPPQQDLSPYATSAWVVQYFLQSIRLSGYAIADNGNNDNNYATAPGSGVVIGVLQKTNYTAIQYRNLQQLVANTWVNVAVV